jgi:hypothetical protein
MDSSCRLLSICKFLDLTNACVKCNKKKIITSCNYSFLPELITVWTLTYLFYYVLYKYLLIFKFCMFIEDNMNYPLILLINFFIIFLRCFLVWERSN